MSLIDVLDEKDWAELRQLAQSLMHRLELFLEQLRDETEIEIIIKFRKKEGPCKRS